MCSSTTFALRHTQISLSGILRHFRPPSRHLLLNMHDTNMEFLQLNGPLLDIFLFFSKTKIFHSHPCATKLTCSAPNCVKFDTVVARASIIFFPEQQEKRGESVGVTGAWTHQTSTVWKNLTFFCPVCQGTC